MAKAVWNNTVIAESDAFETVDGNIYFPADALRQECFKASDKKSSCPWKGVASYYSITVDGEENADAAWYYPDPKAAAENIRGHIAFWRGVEVSQ
ncbi:MAG: hypothetical protein ACI8S3_002420 [Alphaproteobacteria bacterium]|jgi:uncharacterized protein (DUF427 family)